MIIGTNVLEVCEKEALRVFSEAYPTLGKAVEIKYEQYGSQGLKITFEASTPEVPVKLNDDEDGCPI